MDEQESLTETDSAADADPSEHLPPGSHPLEVAARRGFGPLSPLGRQVWHGHTLPCVSCGQLVRRDAIQCDNCGQDMSPTMLDKMRGHAGPWYVLEHVRPFPGVDLERIIRQIRRGLITETTIVRGPSTDHQWRYAVETPGLCRYFGRCWHCYEKVSPSDTYCQHCLSHLSFEPPKSPAATPATAPTGARPGARPASVGAEARHPARIAAHESTHSRATARVSPSEHDSRGVSGVSDDSDHLRKLCEVVDGRDLPIRRPEWDEPPRIAGIRATWVAAALLIVVIVVLTLFTQSRSSDILPLNPTTPTPAQPQP